jgi:hypothetical protein
MATGFCQYCKKCKIIFSFAKNNFTVKIERQKSEDRIQNKKEYVIFIDGGEPSGMIHERFP